MTSGIRLVILAAVSVCCTAVDAFADDRSAWTRVDEHYKLATAPPTKYSVDGSHMDVTAGVALVQPIESMVVATPNAEVHVNRNSLVYVRITPNADHVFVLLGNAAVHVGKHSSTLSSGEESTITSREPTTEDIVGDEIGRRRLRLTKLANGKTIALTEFSLVHAIEREPLLYSLVHSDSHDSKVIRERLIKMAAVLGFVTSRHGPYTTNVR
jgi:hypothetical protein